MKLLQRIGCDLPRLLNKWFAPNLIAILKGNIADKVLGLGLKISK